jgi:hypothetical protein
MLSATAQLIRMSIDMHAAEEGARKINTLKATLGVGGVLPPFAHSLPSVGVLTFNAARAIGADPRHAAFAVLGTRLGVVQ